MSYGTALTPSMTLVARVMKLQSRVLEMKGNVRDARRLHSITCVRRISVGSARIFTLGNRNRVGSLKKGWLVRSELWMRSKQHQPTLGTATSDNRMLPSVAGQILEDWPLTTASVNFLRVHSQRTHHAVAHRSMLYIIP